MPGSVRAAQLLTPQSWYRKSPSAFREEACFEKDLLQQALVKARDNVSLAAKLLNISRDTLRYRIKKDGLK
ncbi:MAG: helix-turn-helix domain-containing protein [bacterium]